MIPSDLNDPDIIESSIDFENREHHSNGRDARAP